MRIAFRNIESQLGRRENPPSHKSQRHRGLVYTSTDLRAVASKCADGAQVRRLLALALVLDGYPRSKAAALNGMDRQTLRDWVHRYTAEGVEGLKSRPPPGRVPALTEPQKA